MSSKDRWNEDGDSDDETTAYVVLPESPRKMCGSVKAAKMDVAALVDPPIKPPPRLETKGGDRQLLAFPSQKLERDDDIGGIEIIIHGMSELDARQERKHERRTDVMRRPSSGTTHAINDIRGEFVDKVEKMKRTGNKVDSSTITCPPASDEILIQPTRIQESTNVDTCSYPAALNKTRKSKFEETEEVIRPSDDYGRRQFHRGNFLRYKYPTQFHKDRSDSSRAAVQKQKLQDRLPPSLCPSVRYGKEPRIQSGSSRLSKKQSKPEEGGRKDRYPVYPPRARHVGVECEILRLVETTDKNVQISATMVNSGCQHRPEVAEKGTQRPKNKPKEVEIQTEQKTFEDTASQIKPEMKNCMVETSVRIMYYPEVNIQNNWTQCDSLIRDESMISRCPSDSNAHLSEEVTSFNHQMSNHNLGARSRTLNSTQGSVIGEDAPRNEDASLELQPSLVSNSGYDVMNGGTTSGRSWRSGLQASNECLSRMASTTFDETMETTGTGYDVRNDYHRDSYESSSRRADRDSKQRHMTTSEGLYPVSSRFPGNSEVPHIPDELGYYPQVPHAFHNSAGQYADSSQNSAGNYADGSHNSAGHHPDASHNYSAGIYTDASQNSAGHYADASHNSAGHYADASHNSAGHYADASQNSAGNYADGFHNSAGHFADASNNSAGHFADASNYSAGHFPDASQNSAGNYPDASHNSAAHFADAFHNSAGHHADASHNSAGQYADASQNSAGHYEDFPQNSTGYHIDASQNSARHYTDGGVSQNSARFSGNASRVSYNEENYDYEPDFEVDLS